MITIQQVFDMAIHMMDEQSENNGNTNTSDTREYKYRTVSILNVLLQQLYPYSDTCDHNVPGRPVCPALIAPESGKEPDMTQVLPLDDVLSTGVLPYGLAGHLLSVENESLSAWFLARYSQAFTDLRNKIPGSFEPIPTPYGLF